MLYAIVCEDRADSTSKRLAARPAHLERLHELVRAGQLVLAGPHPAIDSADPGPAGFTGSLIIAEFESMLVAREWAEADPFFICGVYANVVVKPFVQVLP